MGVNLRLIIATTSALTIVLGVAQIALTCSIFDFVVMNEMFYVNPSKAILIEPKWSFLITIFVLFNISVTSWSLYRLCNSSCGYEQLGKWQKIRQNVSSAAHLLLLIAAAGGALYFCIQFSGMAESVGVYTENAEPRSFQKAASWYHLRLRVMAFLLGCSTALNLISFCLQNNCGDLQRAQEFSKSLGYPKTEC